MMVRRDMVREKGSGQRKGIRSEKRDTVSKKDPVREKRSELGRPGLLFLA